MRRHGGLARNDKKSLFQLGGDIKLHSFDDINSILCYSILL